MCSAVMKEVKCATWKFGDFEWKKIIISNV